MKYKAENAETPEMHITLRARLLPSTHKLAYPAIKFELVIPKQTTCITRNTIVACLPHLKARLKHCQLAASSVPK